MKKSISTNTRSFLPNAITFSHTIQRKKSFKFMAIGILALTRIAAAISLIEKDSEKCLPSQDCWPIEEQWEALNAELGGNLLEVRPLQAPCWDDPEST